jgi:hypothetical protein
MNMLERNSKKPVENGERFPHLPRIHDAIIVPAIAVLMFALGVVYGRSTMTETSPTLTHQTHTAQATYGRFGHL